MTTTTLQGVAREAAGWFETAHRAPEDPYIRLRDGAPEWLTELVYRAHGDMLPDDWRYQTTAAACDWIAETDDPDDPGEFGDSCVDVYTGARLRWLASHLSRPSYCDEAAAEFGTDGRDIVEQIGLGQYAEAREVYGLVLQALEGRAAEQNGDA